MTLTDPPAMGAPEFTPVQIKIGEISALGEVTIEKQPQRGTVFFENPENPTAADLKQFLRKEINENFEIVDGKIRRKFVPIEDVVKPPKGRVDYGWNEDKKIAHLKAAYSRGWKQFPYAPRGLNGHPRHHDGVLHIVGGGPSLKQCLPELRRAARQKKNFVLSLNKTHDFLWNLPKLGLGQAIPSWGAALLDPCDWVKDYITPRPGVQYLIGDQCAPATFDVFDKPDISKWVWRATTPSKDLNIPPKDMVFVFGGSTVGLRCRTLAYLMGFRNIHYWGFDSSAEVSAERPDGKMHGYDKDESVHDRLTVKIIDGHGHEREFLTNSHMARQAQEWLKLRDEWIENVKNGRLGWIEETFHGDGLLPTIAARLGLHADPKKNVKLDMTDLQIPASQAITLEPQNTESSNAA